jgi:thaumarchaeosortase
LGKDRAGNYIAAMIKNIHFQSQDYSRLCICIVVISPFLACFILFPESFLLTWNVGHAGFAFAAAFIFVEIVGIRFRISVVRVSLITLLSILIIAYFIALPLGLNQLIISIGHAYKVAIVNSWVLMSEYFAITIYAMAALFLLLGINWYKVAPAGVVYLVGSTVILSLDSFFPYDSLGPLQMIVPTYLQFDQSILRFIGDHFVYLGNDTPASASGNLLVLKGFHGPFYLQVFWPSAGVQSVIIYSLVMLSILLRLRIPFSHKLIYFLVGALGTASVNILRIVSLSMVAITVTSNVKEWETFHSFAGEIMFLPWIGIYLTAVIFLENKSKN